MTIKVRDGINAWLDAHGCKSVEEIIGYQEGKIKTQELFIFDRTKETLVRSDHRLVHTGKLQKSEL